MKKKHNSTIVLVLILLVGLSVLLYPTVSDWWNSKVQTRAISEYSDVVSNMDAAEYEEKFAEADSYNEALRELTSPLLDYEELKEQYESTLDVTGTGIMGYLDIEKISVHLPIYHGTESRVLNVAVGHLEGSSLPVGGTGTHAVLSAHRGLPSARLFTDLDKLTEGDTFTITILDRVLTYEVDQIRIVDPGVLDDLAIDPDQDYCTLQTCTPYGINTQRLLVRGHRIETTEEVTITNEAYEQDSLWAAPLIAVPILLVLLVVLLVKYPGQSKRSKHRKK